MSQQPNPQAEQLVKEGIEAVKAKDKALARGKLEAAVKIDPYNEKAWFWLASVVETVEEKRTCLGNVILINPQNNRAHEILAKLEGSQPAVASADIAPSGTLGKDGKATSKKSGGGRNPLILLVGGLLGVILCLVLAMMVLGGGDEEAALPTLFPTTSNEQLTATASSPTPSATATASITPTSNATWTPVPQATSTPSPVPLPVLTTGLTGRIIMQSGSSAIDANNQPIVVYSASDGSKILVSGEGQRGQHPALVPGQARFAWQQYSSGTRTLSLHIQSFGVNQSIIISSLINNDPILADTSYPTWYNNNLAFAAKYQGSIINDLWLMPISAALEPTAVPAFGDEVATTAPVEQPVVLEPTATIEGEVAAPEATLPPSPTPITGPIGDSGLVRLTADSANKTWMAFDPTGTALVFVAEQDGVTDLWVINLNSLQTFVLTDNGSALTESAPDWSGNNEIVFSASQAGSNNSDIYIMNADGSADPEILIDFGAHDIQPRFSPDGRYIVFSSDRNGNWDVFAYDRQEDAFYAIETNPDTTDIANDWTP